MAWGRPDSSSGSSPHARGTHGHAARGDGRDRFIPACAGNALDTGLWLTSWTVHPRMRGERIYTSTMIIPIDGSSPHARGTQARHLQALADDRFIPACAGNADRQDIASLVLPVHPRMRGERSSPNPCTTRSSGSSPHARGTQPLGQADSGSGWFIPACAGNAPSMFFSGIRVAVHPRMRGERSIMVRRTVRCCGSSPHARGTP